MTSFEIFKKMNKKLTEAKNIELKQKQKQNRTKKPPKTAADRLGSTLLVTLV